MTSLLTGLSTTCQNTILNTLLTGPFGQCADLVTLSTVLTGSGSLVQPFNGYLAESCPLPGCADSVLTDAQTAVATNCGTDLTAGQPLALLLNASVYNFPEIKNTLCVERVGGATQYGANGTYCLTEILGAAENSTGTTIDVTTLGSLLSGSGSAFQAILGLPNSTYCTDCGDGLADALLSSSLLSESDATSGRALAMMACPAYPGFGNGTLPTGITTFNTTLLSNGTASTNGTAAANTTMMALD